jgi:class 3 adenylate cyclase
MGGSNSRLLSDVTKEQISAHVNSLGLDYQEYCILVEDNGIDGDLLAEMNEEEFVETLDDLQIMDRLHRNKLLDEFKIFLTLTVVTENKQADDDIVRSAHGPIKEVKFPQIMNGVRDYPSPEELKTNNTVRDSSKLPNFQNGFGTETEQQQHLGSDFYSKIDSVPGGHRPPIASDDMERVAQLESYGLEEIEPNSDIAKALTGFVEMAMKLFSFDLADITFLNNEFQFSMARVGLTEPMEKAIMGNVYEAVNYVANGSAFLCRTERSIGICNYPHFSKRTFVVHDIHEDETFKWFQTAGWPFRCYVGAPLLTASGIVLGTLCLHSIEPRLDFDRACEIQLEQVAQMVVQSIDNWKLRRNISQLEETRLSLQKTSNDHKSKPPRGKAVIVVTSIEESMALFEAKPLAMKHALATHNDIIRKLRAQHFGYEVSADGDGFFVAFHDAVDAFSFALNLQQNLYNADWSEEILSCPEAHDDGNAFRGLRVKVAVHMGDVSTEQNSTTSRMEYTGDTVGITKSILSMAYGGQILTTFDTWNVASFLAESKLDSPQVVDLGVHVVRKGRCSNQGVISERILQLVPAPLAVKYSDLSKNNESADNIALDADIPGRQFPEIKSLKKLSSSFFDAPGFNDNLGFRVTIAFIGTAAIEKRYKEASGIISEIIGLAYSALAGTTGYQCQNNMLAFPGITEAAKFGLSFLDFLQRQSPLEDGADPSTLVTYGCVHDTFVTLEPHKTTGRADYFGKVVNRAARVAYTSAPGTVSIGVTSSRSFSCDSFRLEDSSIEVQWVGNRKLKGVEGEMEVFECRRRPN